MLNEKEIKRRAGKIKFTEHARLAMRDDNVLTDDVISALLEGEVIEKYPDAKPFPSCLVYGRTRARKPLHVVCALPIHVDMLIIVTVYIPSEDEWIDFRRRKAR